MNAVIETQETSLDTFKPLKAEIARTVAPTLQIAVIDPSTNDAAIEAAKTIKSLRKQLDDKRKEITDPMRAEIEEIMSYVKDIAEPLVQAETHVRGQINRYAAELEKTRQDELRKAEEERRRKEAELRAKQEAERQAAIEAASIFGEDEAEIVAEIEAKHQAEQITAIVEHKAAVYDAKETGVRNTRRTAKVKVIDLTQVPREYLVLNEKGALAALKAGVSIAGLELDYDISVAIGSNTRTGRRVG